MPVVLRRLNVRSVTANMIVIADVVTPARAFAPTGVTLSGGNRRVAPMDWAGGGRWGDSRRFTGLRGNTGETVFAHTLE